MKIGDIYKHKESNDVISIECFANHINEFNPFKVIIVYAHIVKSMGVWGHIPSFNGYGSAEEIEEKYELVMVADDVRKYDSWDDVMDFLLGDEK